MRRVVRQIGPPLDSFPERSIYDLSFLVDAGLLRFIGPATHPLVRATLFGSEVVLRVQPDGRIWRLLDAPWWRRRKACDALRVLAGVAAYDGPRLYHPQPEG